MKRGVVMGIAAGAVAVLVAAGAAWWLLSRPATPEQTADAYLRALSAGDLDAIQGLLGAPLDEVAIQAFAGADGYLDSYEFAVRSDGSVHAEVELGGEPATVDFVLSGEDGGWKVDADALASLEVTTTIGDSVRIGGALTPTGEIRLLPAVYTITAAPAGLVEGALTATVADGAEATAALTASVSSAGVEAAQEQLDAYVAECARAATGVPPHCGLRVPWAADLATLDRIAFRVEATPVLALAADARTFAATDGVIAATATGTTRAGTAASFTYRAEDWALRGTVSFHRDEMILAVG
ncbi:hypothetical protein [Microbacterium pygmaeum]|uniref:NTF2-like N-terminal transpeptidase domain-containing protein n=1 Tax=Microbacterium pygmaeum TaxID=370764 RepID=A0A1G7Z600_9MICO|nr:hypothetical protein [Microbacterium pygmaeum]SDH03926.1 hypothetical protein SAMN04489810_1957 [Microbacterium pygmaeum]